MNRRKRSKLLGESALFALLLLLLIPVEMICAQAAYETIGEVANAFYWLLIILGNGVVLIAALESRAIAGTLALLVGLVIIPYQVVLMDRLSRVQAEAGRIVAYAHETKLRTGVYPADLTEYTYTDPPMKRFIQHYERSPWQGGFELVYRVGTEDASHWYSPDEGWMYYPD